MSMTLAFFHGVSLVETVMLMLLGAVVALVIRRAVMKRTDESTHGFVEHRHVHVLEREPRESSPYVEVVSTADSSADGDRVRSARYLPEASVRSRAS